MRGAAQTIESLVKEPKFVNCICRIASGRLDNGEFIFWEFCVAKGILTVALLQYPLGSDSLSEKEAKRAVFKNRCVALRFLVDSVLKISQNNDTRFGTKRVSIFVVFDHQNAHRWQSLSDAAGVTKL
jgi:hypothetical protein